MKKVICFCVVLFFMSCQRPKGNQALVSIEGYIQTDPERALKELAEISKRNTDESDKSLYALLLSMALDKNYIDVSNDSIILPAVLYYRKTKDYHHRFLSYYYLGRVYENAEAYEDALSAYFEAESMIDSSISGEYISRLFTARERVYFRQFAMDKALEEAIKAKKCSEHLDNPAFYIRACLDIINILKLEQKHDIAADELSSLTQWASNHHARLPSSYYYWALYQLIYSSKESPDSLKQYYGLYTDVCKDEGRDPEVLLHTDVLVKLKEYQEALELFQSINLGPDAQTTDSIQYYSTATSIYYGLRDFDNYSSSIRQYNRLVESMNNSIFNKDVRYLEERFNNQRLLEKKQQKALLLSIIVGTLLLIMTIGATLGRRSIIKQQRLIEDLQSDYSFIKEAFSNSGDDMSDIKQQLGNRLRALTPYFRSVPSKPFREKELSSLKRDNQEMLRSIGLLFSLSFPDFVSSLVKFDLNAAEIGLCSLYASGYITKELTDMIDKGSIYLINSSIRSKIGDSINGRTLPAWLREKFNSR